MCCYIRDQTFQFKSSQLIACCSDGDEWEKIFFVLSGRNRVQKLLHEENIYLENRKLIELEDFRKVTGLVESKNLLPIPNNPKDILTYYMKMAGHEAEEDLKEMIQLLGIQGSLFFELNHSNFQQQ